MITILGPTASGKTSLAIALAADLGGEIISADSRQVYRGMDIGTGKDLADYCVNGKQIPYHLIDIVEPGEKYNLFQYQIDFHSALSDIESRGAQPILCGGTGLYIEAVLKGYQLAPVPENKPLRHSLDGKSLVELSEILAHLKSLTGSTMHNVSDIDTAQRAIRAIEIETFNLLNKNAGASPYDAEKSLSTFNLQPSTKLIFGVSISRDERRSRITQRLRKRLSEGMVDEVAGLLRRGISYEDLTYYGLEYKYVTDYVVGNTTYDEMFSRLEIAIHQFAKRQMTWFRGMERRGLPIHWIDHSLPLERKIEEIKLKLTR